MRRPPLQTRGRQRWSGDSWGCSPRTAEAGCTGIKKRGKKSVYHHWLLSVLLFQNRGGGVSSTALHPWINLSQGGISFHVWEHLPEVQLSAVQDNNSDGEKPFVSVSVYSGLYPWLSVYITVSHDADLCENYCCSRKIKWKRKKIISEDFFLTTKGICTKQHPMTLVYSNKQWLEMIKQLTSEVPLQPNNLKPRLHNAMLERSC